MPGGREERSARQVQRFRTPWTRAGVWGRSLSVTQPSVDCNLKKHQAEVTILHPRGVIASARSGKPYAVGGVLCSYR